MLYCSGSVHHLICSPPANVSALYAHFDPPVNESPLKETEIVIIYSHTHVVPQTEKVDVLKNQWGPKNGLDSFHFHRIKKHRHFSSFVFHRESQTGLERHDGWVNDDQTFISFVQKIEMAPSFKKLVYFADLVLISGSSHVFWAGFSKVNAMAWHGNWSLIGRFVGM